MSGLAPVVVYGRDPRLLETRRLVLETLGGQVCAAADRTTTERLLHELKPGVLVLCYTLPAEEREFILTFARENYPAMKVLTLRADGPVVTQTSEHFSIFTGPRALKLKVSELLLR